MGPYRGFRNGLGHRLFIVIKGLLAVLTVALGIDGCLPKPAGPLGGGIHGHVVVLLGPGGDTATALRASVSIELPGASVTAKNVATGTTSSAAVTNAHGYFQLPRQAPGVYQICASAPGFTSGCLSTNTLVDSFTVVLPNELRLQPQGAVIAGRVFLNDKSGTPCFTDRPAFRTFVSAKVTLEDANHTTVAGPVFGNGLGQYILPAVRVPQGQYEVVALCQGAEGRAPFTAGAAQTLRDVLIANSPPRIHRIEATIGNQPVRTAPLGATVTLRAVAEDPDGNPLSFRWVDSNGASIGAPSASVQFTVPQTPFSTMFFVEVNDGLGGFAYSSIPVTGTAAGEALFTGSVVDANSGAPIPGAAVTINGKPVQADLKGLFTITVPTDVRYTLSVRKRGYALLSKVTYSPAGGLRLPLEPVIGQPFDIRAGGKIEYRDSRKRNLPVTLTLPPNSLVDAKGNPAVGPGRAYVWGYPPGTPIPGDMSAIFQGKSARLETFGAVDIELTDASGQRLQLRSGATMALSMSAVAYPNPPAMVPLFRFDEVSGLWREHGVLTLVGNEYHGTISHLTSFNADLEFGTSGCIEYHVDVENSPSLPFNLHIEQNGQTANHEPFQVNDFAGVVSRLRPAQPTDWWALPSPTSAKADAVGHGTITSSNFTSNPNDPNGDFPTVGAKDSTNNPICNAFTLTADFPNHETFLTGLPGQNSQTDETNYRTAVDAWAGPGSRATFSDFKNTNGFPGANESTAVYFNNADLKLGRDMHCRIAAAGKIACYVSNYLDKAVPPAGSAPALLAAAAAHTSGNTNLLFATVAMEWDPIKPVAQSVQFFVYNAAGARVTQATLDGEGPKSIPQICVACHGGYYDSGGDHLAHEARFLPFDVASFLLVDDDFSAQAVSQLGLDPFTRLNQLGQFRGLNALVLQTETGRPQNSHGINAVVDLINGWYAGCGGVNNGTCGTCVGPQCQDSFRDGYRPATWASQPLLYDNVVRVACRGCHIMQPSFDWTDLSDFTGSTFAPFIERLVCTGNGQPSNQRRMAHAEVPFKAFWQSTVAPGLLKQAPMNFAHCERQ